ncbi:MAG: GGDEF domain-containing protein, partial [Anaerolineaceae bacterium]|nr:GGDEF domain-containing protein [Anaerolineaceae bacterium]
LLASLIMKSMRSVDIVARYGGEEFVVILPDTALAEAVLVAERLRNAALNLLKIAENPLVRGEMLTISLGVASAPKHGLDAQDLLKAADRFLYQAKHTGKNRVGFSE